VGWKELNTGDLEPIQGETLAKVTPKERVFCV
jgi:hypothetical protein